MVKHTRKELIQTLALSIRASALQGFSIVHFRVWVEELSQPNNPRVPTWVAPMVDEIENKRNGFTRLVGDVESKYREWFN